MNSAKKEVTWVCAIVCSALLAIFIGQWLHKRFMVAGIEKRLDDIDFKLALLINPIGSYEDDQGRHCLMFEKREEPVCLKVEYLP